VIVRATFPTSFSSINILQTDKPEKGGQPPWTMDDFYALSVTELGYIILFGEEDTKPLSLMCV
jgi:hypothetical protein